MPYRDLDPRTAHAELQRDPGIVALDVRTEPEHRSHRLAGALLIPVQELERRLGELDPDADYLVHCEHGMRSLGACELLSHYGFRRLRNLRGGLAGWAGAGLPLQR